MGLFQISIKFNVNALYALYETDLQNVWCEWGRDISWVFFIFLSNLT